MVVILQKDVSGTGKAGDVVKVSDGYARNMLIPRGLAKEATSGNVRNLEKQKKVMEEKRAAEKAQAEELAAKIESAEINIETKGGESGRLFGSVTNKDIAEAISEQLGIEVDKKKIVMDAPIKETGASEVTVRLFSEVSAKLKVNVSVV